MSALRLTVAVAVLALTAASPANAWSWGGWTPHGFSASGGSTAVPEPSDFALFALGAAGLIAGRWRARR